MADKMADTGSMSKDKRSEYGTGGLYQRTSDWRWMATLEAGHTASGARKRVTVSGKGCVDGCAARCPHRAAVKRKLRDKRLAIERDGQRPMRRTTSVAKWSTEWLEAIKPNVRPNAYATDRAAVRTIVAAIGSVKLAELTPADIRTVAARVRGEGLSTSTALRYQGSLMRMLRAAALDGYSVPPNVMLAPKPAAAVNDRKALPVDQAVAALVHIAGLEGGDRSRWALAFLQGHRPAESLGLTWPEVDLDAGTLRISWQLQTLTYLDRKDPAAGFFIPDGYEVRHLVGAYHLVRPKSEAGWRAQPLVPWAAAALELWRDVAPENPHQLVWPGRVVRNVTWPRNDAVDREQWHAMQAELGIWHPEGKTAKRPHGRYHVHEIRHTTATVLLALGVPESVRIQIMGHSSIASTKAYEHVDLTLARSALGQAAERLGLTSG